MNALAQILAETSKPQKTHENGLAGLLSTQPNPLMSNIVSPNRSVTKPEIKRPESAMPQMPELPAEKKSPGGFEKVFGAGLQAFVDGYSPQTGQQMRQIKANREYRDGRAKMAEAIKNNNYDAASAAAFGIGDINAGLDLREQQSRMQKEQQAQQKAFGREQIERSIAGMGHLKQIQDPQGRLQFIQSNPDVFRDLIDSAGMPDLEDMQDQNIDMIMRSMQAGLGVGPETTERKIMEDVNGVQRYVDSGEQVFEGITAQVDRDLPTGMYWDEETQSAQYYPAYLQQQNKAKAPAPMSEYQRKRLELDRDKFELEQQPEPNAFMGFNDYSSPNYGGLMEINGNAGLYLTGGSGEKQFRSFNTLPEAAQDRDQSIRVTPSKDQQKADIKQLDEYRTQADQATEIINSLYSAESVLNGPDGVKGTKDDFKTGPMLDMRKGISNAIPGVSKFEENYDKFATSANQATLSSLAKMKGSPSDKDLLVVINSSIATGKGDEANRDAISKQSAALNIIKAKPEFASWWIQNYGSTYGSKDEAGRSFDTAWAEFSARTARDMRLITDQQYQRLSPSPTLQQGGSNLQIKGVPDNAVAYLRQNPQFAEQFNQKYGAGLAEQVLSQ